MEARYPGIKFISLAVLEDYQFIINSSGIPTIIHCPGGEDNQSKVYGMVYALQPDHFEDIKIMKVENEIRGGEGIDEFKIDTGMVKLVGDWVANGFNAGYEPTEEQFKAKDKEIGVWMFADRQEKDATIRSEKLSHGLQNGMNKGMMEAMIQGMPKTYEGVLRSHVPFPKTPHGVFW